MSLDKKYPGLNFAIFGNTEHTVFSKQFWDITKGPGSQARKAIKPKRNKFILLYLRLLVFSPRLILGSLGRSPHHCGFKLRYRVTVIILVLNVRTMKVNVSVVAKVLSEKTYSPTEIALKLKDFVGKNITPDVEASMLIADFKAFVAGQIGTVTLNAKYAVEFGGAELPNDKTLGACGMTDGCAVKFCVILTY